ncbi:seven-hairpin glycosidase [Trametopsis cervina]|nr:seven-hairpin glycosidase [Trametopsis cervina]
MSSILFRRVRVRHIGVGLFGLVLLSTFYHLYPHRIDPILSQPESVTLALDEPDRPPNWPQRADEVKQAFLHAYHAYEKYALPKDHLLPVSSLGVNDFNGWGVTMYDSLSTMLLMDLKDEFARALPLIAQQNFTMPPAVVNKNKHTAPVVAPFFETVIRYLGGLLSAYALSKEPILLDRADNLGTKLWGAFDTPSGLPAYGVNTENGKNLIKSIAVLAEVASCQLEYVYLAKLTGKKEHYDRSARIMQILNEADRSALGMFPSRWDVLSGLPIGHQLSVGGAADSAHEYLLKLYLLTGKSDQASLDLYIQTANTVLSTLLYVSPLRGLLYVTDLSPSPMPSHKFEHLSCFLPGLLALGVHSLPDTAFATQGPTPTSSKTADELRHWDWKELHMLAAQGLAESCYQMYEDQPTGLGPDEVKFIDGGELWVNKLEKWRMTGKQGNIPGIGAKKQQEMRGGPTEYSTRSGRYLLRPETVESIYLMWRVTGDDVWRERGYAIFRALEREAKMPVGYASLRSVSVANAHHNDDMPSYFLAETLKYLFLLFHDEDLVPLDRWVFNTEAHPLPIFEWTSVERTKFGIQ